MKSKFNWLLIMLVGFIILGSNQEVFANERDFTLKNWATNLFYNGEGKLVGTKNSALDEEQIFMSESNNSWQALTDEELNTMSTDWVLKKSNYTYWGYVINYKDRTREFFNQPTITYDELCSLELNRGKEINYIDIIYGDTGSITINYNLVKSDGSKELLKSDYSYGLFNINLPGRIELVGEATNLDPIVDNYIIVSQDAEAPFYYEENTDKVINIDLRNPQYIIHFVDELGNKIRDSEKISAGIGEIFNYEAPLIDDYTVKENGTINDIYLKEDKEFTITYEKNSTSTKTGKVLVNYEDKEGNVLTEPETLSGNLGETYKTNAKEIAGYKLIDVKGEEEGTYSELEKKITYVYEKNDPEIESGKVLVNYEDKEGNVLTEPETLTGNLGETYKTNAKEIAGYKLIDVKGEEEGTYSELEKTITYVYEKNDPEIESGKVLVNYEDEEGNVLSEPETLTGNLGETYKTNAKEIAGYELINVKGEEEDIYNEVEKVVTYVYGVNKKNKVMKKNNLNEFEGSNNLPKTGENILTDYIISNLGVLVVFCSLFLYYRKF